MNSTKKYLKWLDLIDAEDIFDAFCLCSGPNATVSEGECPTTVLYDSYKDHHNMVTCNE